MQSPSLPPLNSLHVFAIAGGELSFKRAAERLRVSPGAVSQQIKLLEHHLGCTLFRRGNRTLELTDEGARLLLPLRQAFQTMADAVAAIAEARQPAALIVTTMPSFGARWLVPRLGRFRRKYPDIEVMVNATPRLVDLLHEPVDVGIRAGLGRYPGLKTERLLEVDLFPVCHPRLLEGRHPIRIPADLRHHTLLHDESFSDWTQWLKAQKVAGVDPRRGPVFSDANLVLLAALEREGVALSYGPLVEEDLRCGRLVKPFDLPLLRHFAYYLVCQAGREHEPRIRAFREWIFEELQDSGSASRSPPSKPVKRHALATGSLGL